MLICRIGITYPISCDFFFFFDDSLVRNSFCFLILVQKSKADVADFLALFVSPFS